MATKTTTRRLFTDEYKREAVSLLATSGRPLTQGAMNGVAKPGTDTPAGHAAATISAEQAEIRRLRRDLERVQMERDILKQAIGIFSGPPR